MAPRNNTQHASQASVCSLEARKVSVVSRFTSVSSRKEAKRWAGMATDPSVAKSLARSLAEHCCCRGTVDEASNASRTDKPKQGSCSETPPHEAQRNLQWPRHTNQHRGLHRLTRMPDSAAFTVLKVATIASAIGLFVSPAPDLYRIHKSKVIGEVSIMPLVSMCGCAYLWVIYGFLLSNVFPVAITNLIGLFAASFYSGVYLFYTTERRYVLKMLGFVGLGLAAVTLYAVLGASGVTDQSNKQVGKIVGFIAVSVNIVLYGSPFETITKVLKTKNASSLPIALCFVAMLNCALWVLYGLLDDDMFVLTPNAIGLVFSVVQVALYVKYKPSKHGLQQINPDGGVQLSSVVVELSPKAESSYGSYTIKSPTIEPLRSPLAPVAE